MRSAPAAALVLASAFAAGSAHAANVTVTNPNELTAAVNAAQPGDVITVADGNYTMTAPVEAAANGSAGAPIRLVAATLHGAVLVAAGGIEAPLRISGAFWIIDGLDFSGGTYGVRFLGNGHDGVLADARIADAAVAGVRGDCGGAEAQPHCDDDLVAGVEVTRASTVTGCSFAGVEIVGAVGWRVSHLFVHDVAVDSLACPMPATAGLMARGNTQQLAADALVVDGVVDGLSLGPASDPCAVRGTTVGATSCTAPTTCAAQGVVTNALLLDNQDHGALFTNACNVSLHGATLWNDGIAFGGQRSIELRTAGTVDVSNVILNAALVTGQGTAATGSGNLTLPTPTDTSWFLDAAGGNFRLAAGTPPVDTGITLADEPADLDGVARPQGTAYDVGAYERPLGGYPDGGIPMLDGGIDGGFGGGTGATPGMGGGMTQPPKEAGCQCNFGTAAGLDLLAPLAFAALLLMRRRKR